MASAKSVLIIGGSGFVGTHLSLYLRDHYKVFATYNTHRLSIPGVSPIPLNLANRNWAKRVLYSANPDVVIYAAGSNSAQRSEEFPREAEGIHSGGPSMLTSIADVLQPKFIFLSNCYPFEGRKGNYHETDVVLPSTALGKAKLGGENFVKNKCVNYVIVRSSPLLGRGNGLRLSLLDRLRMSLGRGETVEMTTHELHNFALVGEFAQFIHRVIDGGVKNRVLHFGGLTKLTHLELAQAFARRFKYDPALVVPTKTVYQNVGALSSRANKISSSNEIQTFDYSLNSTQAAQLLKLQPLILEQSFDLLEEQLTARL